MRSTATLLVVIVAASLLTACATTEFVPGPPQGDWAISGQVESVGQGYEQVRGNPGGGAVAGAIIGGVLGTALGGRGLGTFIGATEGAMIGAHTSQGGYVGAVFHVNVRFEDGSLRTFVYRDQLPFRSGDYVVWTSQGLFRR